MFRIVPIDPSKPPGTKRGRPLHVSLLCSSHDHTDPEKAGVILTVGKEGCDINFPDAIRREQDVLDTIGHRGGRVHIVAQTASGEERRFDLDLDRDVRSLFDIMTRVAKRCNHPCTSITPMSKTSKFPRIRMDLSQVPFSGSVRELDLSSGCTLRFRLDAKLAVSPPPRPQQVLRLVTSRKDLLEKTWSSPKDGTPRRFMSPRNEDEWRSCTAASDGIILVLEDINTRNCTRVMGGKQPLADDSIIHINIEGFDQNLRFWRSDSVWHLLCFFCAHVGSSTGGNWSCYRFFHRGAELSDLRRSLESYGVKNGSTIFVQLRDGFTSEDEGLSAKLNYRYCQHMEVMATWRVKSRREVFHLSNESFVLTSQSLPSDEDICRAVAANDAWGGRVASASAFCCEDLKKAVFGPAPASCEDDLTFAIEVVRVPLNICPSGISASTMSRIEAVAPSVGVSLADSAIGFNSTPYHPLLSRTHLLVPGERDEPELRKASLKTVSAFCMNVPVITAGYVLKGLAGRKSFRDALPFAAKFLPVEGSTGVAYSVALRLEDDGVGPCSGRRDPLRGFFFISLAPTQTEGLVLAAGGYIYRAYMMSDRSFFDDAWLQNITSPDTPGVAVISDAGLKIDSKLSFLSDRGFRLVGSSQIISSVIGMKAFVEDISGELIVANVNSVPAKFRLSWQSGHRSLETLPSDALRRVLDGYLGGFEDLRSMFSLARCSKDLAKLVYEESPYLWTHLDFTFYDEKFRKRMRDKQLEALFRKIDAANVVKLLDLEGCRGLSGNCLGPLIGSNTLQELNLRFCNGGHSHRDVIPDAETICKVIKSMPPFYLSRSDTSDCRGLLKLQLDTYRFSSTVFVSKGRRENTERLNALMTEFGSKLAESTICKDCNKPMGDEIIATKPEGIESTEWTSNQAISSLCFSCMDIVCGNSDGCRKVWRCSDCSTQYCSRCDGDLEKVCRSCANRFCCRELHECIACNLYQCDVCADYSEDHILTTFCSDCDEMKCSQCQAHSFCHYCGSSFCVQHRRTTLCASCDESYCRTGCGHQMSTCHRCDRLHCEDCMTSDVCRGCGEKSCEGCIATTCPSCQENFCIGCIEDDEVAFSSCIVCKKNKCGFCIMECDEELCDETICKDCRPDMAGCLVCDNVFCDDHVVKCTLNCGKVVCLECLKEPSCDDDSSSISTHCGKCPGVQCRPLWGAKCDSFICCKCIKEDKEDYCNVCEEVFPCRSEHCPKGRLRLWCKACEESYCYDCAGDHKDHCKDIGNHESEVVWVDAMDELMNRRMKRFFANPHYYAHYSSAYSLRQLHSYDEFVEYSFKKKLEVTEQVYGSVREKHKNVAILDIGPSSTQPRIDQKFRKKTRPSLQL